MTAEYGTDGRFRWQTAATIDNHTLGDDPSDCAYVELGYDHFGE